MARQPARGGAVADPAADSVALLEAGAARPGRRRMAAEAHRRLARLADAEPLGDHLAARVAQHRISAAVRAGGGRRVLPEHDLVLADDGAVAPRCGRGRWCRRSWRRPYRWRRCRPGPSPGRRPGATAARERAGRGRPTRQFPARICGCPPFALHAARFRVGQEPASQSMDRNGFPLQPANPVKARRRARLQAPDDSRNNPH